MKSFVTWRTSLKLLQIFLKGPQGANGLPGIDGEKGEKVIEVIYEI